MQRARHLISFPASIFFFFLIFPISIFRSADNTVDNYSSSHTFALFWFFPRFSNCHLFFIIFFFLLSSSFLPSFLPSFAARADASHTLHIHHITCDCAASYTYCTPRSHREGLGSSVYCLRGHTWAARNAGHAYAIDVHRATRRPNKI